jgi:hypothetical protein
LFGETIFKIITSAPGSERGFNFKFKSENFQEEDNAMDEAADDKSGRFGGFG